MTNPPTIMIMEWAGNKMKVAVLTAEVVRMAQCKEPKHTTVHFKNGGCMTIALPYDEALKQWLHCLGLAPKPETKMATRFEDLTEEEKERVQAGHLELEKTLGRNLPTHSELEQRLGRSDPSPRFEEPTEAQKASLQLSIEVP
jgi:hypothetical protein